MKDELKTIRSTCRLCYNSCGVIVHLRNGIPVRVEGDPCHPINKGLLCAKGYASLEYLNSPNRLKYPLKRIGLRGEGKWERISWEMALELVAKGLMQSRDRYGVLSTVFIRGASKGLSDDLLARFANIFGSPNITSPAPYCFVPGTRSSQFTYGYYSYPDYAFGPKIIVVWGLNPIASNHLEYENIKNAKKNGAKLIVIDPLNNELTEMADIWVRIKPGTDSALALGLINNIISESTFDKEFVEKYTVGFEKLKKYVEKYSLEKVEKITWVNSELIKKIAVLYSTIKPGVILWGNGIEHNINSFDSCRAITILRSISGNLGIPGGEVKYSNPGNIGRGDPEFLCQSNIPTEIREQRLSKKDAILPVNYYALPQRIVKAILEDDPYPVRAAYIQAANVITHWPDSQKTFKALQKMDFIAVAEQFLTPTAEVADILLPAATYLEYDSVEQPYHYPLVSIQQKVAQVGETKSDGEILNELVKIIGHPEYAYKNMEILLDNILKPSGVSFKEFKNIGYFLGKKSYRHYEREGFDTDSKKVELFSKKLNEMGFNPLPTYQDILQNVSEKTRNADQSNILIVVSRKDDVYRHSGGRQIPSLRQVAPEPKIKLNPKTALRLAVKQGEMAYIESEKGKIEQRVEFDELLDERVAQIDYAWWFPEETGQKKWKKSNINILTDGESGFNKEMGSPNFRGFLCKIYKKV